MSRGAEALKQALKKEKSRVDLVETRKFVLAQKNEKAYEASQKYPRSLANNTFFTPHLGRSRPPLKRNDEIAHDYAVIVTVNGKSMIASSSYNPTRKLDSQIPSNLPADIASKIHTLERQGFRFNGTNKDILVFERLYNQKQRDRRWASRSAAVLAGSVFILTVALFAGEVAAKH